MLAGNQPFNASDVEDLLGYWEDHPSPTSVTWVTNRARHASGDDQVSWLAYLNDNGHPQAVLDVLGDGSGLSDAVADQYIEALVETENDNKDRLVTYLEESIEAETNIDRLRKLTIIADEEDAGSAPEKGWRKIYALNPGDSDAAKAIGLIDFYADNYDEAKIMLQPIIDQVHDDYRVLYAYGEILQQDDRKADAEPYYRRALQLISAITEPDDSTRLDEAYLLYRTDHITESLALFRQLYAKYPGDKDLRADFAEVLTETGRFEEATALLSQQ
jgi:tetratricopeptide (TPR) repeat protein